jgi:hypothetical protein
LSDLGACAKSNHLQNYSTITGQCKIGLIRKVFYTQAKPEAAMMQKVSDLFFAAWYLPEKLGS